MRTSIGSPGSFARFLDDRSRDPSADPFPARYVVLGYATNSSNRIDVVGCYADKAQAERIAKLPTADYWYMSALDAASYGCKIV